MRRSISSISISVRLQSCCSKADRYDSLVLFTQGPRDRLVRRGEKIAFYDASYLISEEMTQNMTNEAACNTPTLILKFHFKSATKPLLAARIPYVLTDCHRKSRLLQSLKQNGRTPRVVIRCFVQKTFRCFRFSITISHQNLGSTCRC
jgi:hypothetical protein